MGILDDAKVIILLIIVIVGLITFLVAWSSFSSKCIGSNIDLNNCTQATGQFIIDMITPNEVTILLTFGGIFGVIILLIYFWATRGSGY